MLGQNVQKNEDVTHGYDFFFANHGHDFLWFISTEKEKKEKRKKKKTNHYFFGIFFFLFLFSFLKSMKPSTYHFSSSDTITTITPATPPSSLFEEDGEGITIIPSPSRDFALKLATLRYHPRDFVSIACLEFLSHLSSSSSPPLSIDPGSVSAGYYHPIFAEIPSEEEYNKSGRCYITYLKNKLATASETEMVSLHKGMSIKEYASIYSPLDSFNNLATHLAFPTTEFALATALSVGARKVLHTNTANSPSSSATVVAPLLHTPAVSSENHDLSLLNKNEVSSTITGGTPPHIEFTPENVVKNSEIRKFVGLDSRNNFHDTISLEVCAVEQKVSNRKTEFEHDEVAADIFPVLSVLSSSSRLFINQKFRPYLFHPLGEDIDTLEKLERWELISNSYSHCTSIGDGYKTSSNPDEFKNPTQRRLFLCFYLMYLKNSVTDGFQQLISKDARILSRNRTIHKQSQFITKLKKVYLIEHLEDHNQGMVFFENGVPDVSVLRPEKKAKLEMGSESSTDTPPTAPTVVDNTLSVEDRKILYNNAINKLFDSLIKEIPTEKTLALYENTLRSYVEMFIRLQTFIEDMTCQVTSKETRKTSSLEEFLATVFRDRAGSITSLTTFTESIKKSPAADKYKIFSDYILSAEDRGGEDRKIRLKRMLGSMSTLEAETVPLTTNFYGPTLSNAKELLRQTLHLSILSIVATVCIGMNDAKKT